MTLKRSTLLISAAMTIAVLGTSPAVAEDYTAFIQELERFNDPQPARLIEERLVRLVTSGNKKALISFSEELHEQDGHIMAQFAKIAALLESGDAAKNPDLDRVVMQFNPCHQANILVRNIVTGVVDDEAAVAIHYGILDIEESDADDLYAENIARCERLKSLPVKLTYIGSIGAL